MKKCVMVIVAALVCVVNPMMFSIGCGAIECGEPPATNYTRQDVANEARDVPSVQSVTLDDGSTMDITLNINMASLQESVQQAQLRQKFESSLVKSAQACRRPSGDSVDFEASLSVVVTRTTGERDVVLRAALVKGFYVVDSTSLTTGRLEVYERDLDTDISETTVDVELTYVTQTGRGAEAVLTNADIDRNGEFENAWDYSGN